MNPHLSLSLTLIQLSNLPIKKMDLSGAQHHQLHHHFPHQEIWGSDHSDSRSLDTVIPSPNPTQTQDQKKPRPPDGEPQKCPRCDSTNTKFCYYNNYSLTQPRYFCKACRRYWTKGGTLRNVPVGGGCRKSSKRSSASSPSLSPSHFIKRPHSQDTVPATGPVPNPIFSNLSLHTYSGGLGLDSWQHQLDLPMSTRILPEMSFLQQFQYGNSGGLMFQNLCSYEEAGGGNSNCASGISEDVAAAIGPYEDVLSSGQAVKEERDESGGLWGLPWQINGDHGSLMGGGGGDLEPIRDNWNGLIGNSAWGLLNTPALM